MGSSPLANLQPSTILGSNTAYELLLDKWSDVNKEHKLFLKYVFVFAAKIITVKFCPYIINHKGRKFWHTYKVNLLDEAPLRFYKAKIKKGLSHPINTYIHLKCLNRGSLSLF